MNLNDRESQVKAPDHLQCATSAAAAAGASLLRLRGGFGGTCFGRFFFLVVIFSIKTRDLK